MKFYFLSFFLLVVSTSFTSEDHCITQQEKVFIQTSNPNNGQLLIIEEDEYSVYAYIIRKDKKGIDFDGFLCSVVDPKKDDLDLEAIMESGAPPPLIKKYANDFSYVKNLKEKDITITWNSTSVEIKIKGEKYLIMDFVNKVSYSKSLKMDGPYGKMLPKP